MLLSDSAKGNREAAIKALQRLRPAALRPSVVGLAESGRSKAAREAAAEVLAGWP